MNPTDQRLKMIPHILENDLTLFEGVLLTGSMVFGKYHSVHEASDIDLIFIIDAAKIGHLRQNSLFKSIEFSDDFIEAFSEGRIDRFWLDLPVDGVRLNLGVWDSRFLDTFIALKAEFHKLGTHDPSVPNIEAVDPFGKRHAYKPELERYGSLYIKKFPLMSDGTPISSPTYNNLVASEALYDPQAVWGPKIKGLIHLLNQRYGSEWVDHFLAHVIRKSSSDYLVRLRERVAAA